jgi:hypothetical protein
MFAGVFDVLRKELANFVDGIVTDLDNTAENFNTQQQALLRKIQSCDEEIIRLHQRRGELVKSLGMAGDKMMGHIAYAQEALREGPTQPAQLEGPQDGYGEEEAA